MESDPDAVWGASDYAPTAQRLAVVTPLIARAALGAVRPPAVVLDVGAGHGGLASRLSEDGYDVIALEPTRRMRDVGRRQTSPSVAWLDATAESTGLADASVDLVVSSFGLMFAEPTSAVEEMARVLRPGGCLITTAWAATGFLHEMTCRMISVLPQLAAAGQHGWGEPGIAVARLESYFDEIAVEERRLPWRFRSVAEGMGLYRAGSPVHAATFVLAGNRRADLEDVLERQLRDHATSDGSVDANASYVLISAVRR